MRKVLPVAIVMFFLSAVSASPARAAVITFDDLDDLTSVDSSYAGVTFANAVVLTAGFSLNEFEFPPYSGENVAFDADGPMRVDFATPVGSVGAFFTYLAPLIFEAFSASGVLLASASSLFNANLALSGDVGSLPNEFIGVSATGIAYVVISGDPAGGSFTLDNFTYDAETQSVPEPTTLGLILAGLIGLRLGRYRR